MDERTRHQMAVDAMLDLISEQKAQIKILEERLAYAENEALNCYESNGLVL